jgi:hypothetical protein
MNFPSSGARPKRAGDRSGAIFGYSRGPWRPLALYVMSMTFAEDRRFHSSQVRDESSAIVSNAGSPSHRNAGSSSRSEDVTFVAPRRQAYDQ